MRITLPTFIYRGPGNDGRHTVAPLFRPDDSITRLQLSNATAELAKGLRETIRGLATDGHHDQLWKYLYDPNPSLHRLKIHPQLKKQYLELHMPIVAFRSNGRRYAFCPVMRQIWFDVERGEDLTQRTDEIVTRILREREQENADNSWVDFFQKKRRYWLSDLELDVSLARQIKKAKKVSNLAELFGRTEPMDGARELYRVGRCLEDLYPDGLHVAFLRDDFVKRLHDWYATGNRRPLLLVGEPLVGKTAIIHEWVRQRCATRRGAFGGKEQTYLIAPQRLISGMSYVGQWEERWNQILRTSKKKSHVLYFDDLLGLFAAGKSASSNLSAAHVLKSYVARRDVAVLAEMTPTELRVFREKDRGFADMFEVIQLSPPSLAEAMHCVVKLLSELEARHETSFRPQTVPLTLELSQQFTTRGVLPGTAASAMRQLATRHEKRVVNTEQVLELFSQRTGLENRFVDARTQLKVSDVREYFSKRLVGQPDAVDALIQVVSVAKAQLGDGKRPLATLLFAGPTGVGKTEAAKLLAEYLFDDQTKMIRFDLNEFVQPGSALRLIGTFDRPDGLLTNAVRQQPFNVLLLDEIEKAHPEVFDLLLQVLGEGRLTDARGRTVDFSKSIIIMTSNVGAEKSAHSIGFVETDDTAQQRFIGEIRKFWRPEFFNRIDRVVPFRKLSREDLAEIADILLGKLLARDGFQRRAITVVGDTDALDWVVERGYSESLGGRAMRRAVERELVGPISHALSSMLPNEMAVIRVFKTGDRIETAVLPIEGGTTCVATSAEPDSQQSGSQELAIHPEHRDSFFQLVRSHLAEMLERCEALRETEAYEDLTHPLAFERIATVDYLRRLRAKAKALEEYDEHTAESRKVLGHSKRPSGNLAKGRKRERYTHATRSPDRQHHKEIHAFQDIDEYIQDEITHGGMYESNSAYDMDVKDPTQAFRSLLDDIRDLPLVVPSGSWNYQRAVLIIRTMNRIVPTSLVRTLGAMQNIGSSQLMVGMLTPGSHFDEDELDRGGLKIDRLTKHSAWMEVRRTMKGSPQRPECVVPDHVLGDRLSGVFAEGHNAFEWLKPAEGTLLIASGNEGSQPVQVIVRKLEEAETVEQCIARLMDEHEEFSSPRMDNARDPFQLLPVNLKTDQRTRERCVSRQLAAKRPLPEQLQRCLRTNEVPIHAQTSADRAMESP